MSSRIEQRRSRTGDAAPVIALVPTTGDERLEQSEDTSKERPWQILVRKLRGLVAFEDVPEDGSDTKAPSEERPALRVLPGGRLGECEDQRQKTAVTRGKWH